MLKDTFKHNQTEQQISYTISSQSNNNHSTTNFPAKQFSQTFQNPIQPIMFENTLTESTIAQNNDFESFTPSQENLITAHDKSHLAIKQTQNIQANQANNSTSAIKQTQNIQANNSIANSTQSLPKSKEILNKTSHTSNIQARDLQQGFFHQTQALLDSMSGWSIFDKENLQKGIKIDFISNNDSLFFTLYVGAELHLACAYSSVLDERTFIKEESPRLHFIKCEEAKLIPKEFITICVPTKNSFDYRVRANGVDTRLFYEHPLRICPLCISMLCRILSKKYNKEVTPDKLKEQEIMNLLLKNKLKNLIF